MASLKRIRDLAARATRGVFSGVIIWVFGAACVIFGATVATVTTLSITGMP